MNVIRQEVTLLLSLALMPLVKVRIVSLVNPPTKLFVLCYIKLSLILK